MLTEQRYEKILALLKQKKSITVSEITQLLNISESTARRDITALHQAGRLTKVFGGAVPCGRSYIVQEPTVAQKVELHKEEKIRIACHGASLVTDSDFVYLDAGTTTGYMLDYLSEKKATFVTNAVSHARQLASQGNKVFLIGGELKGSTEAVIGVQAMETLMKYHFTKGFFGTNGISMTDGFMTPDVGEAQIKRTAAEQCLERYVLADSSKFGKISSVTFAPFESAVILTEHIPDEYTQCGTMIRADAFPPDHGELP